MTNMEWKNSPNPYLEPISKKRLSAHGCVAARLPAIGGTHILTCMLRFFAEPRLLNSLIF
jgi:hypothetical protein